jgi:hypothetical protein
LFSRELALGMVYIGSNIGGALIPLVATALAVELAARHRHHGSRCCRSLVVGARLRRMRATPPRRQ